MGVGGYRDTSLRGLARVASAKNWLIKSIFHGLQHAQKHSLASLAKVFKIDRYYISLTGMADEMTIGQADIEPILDR